MRVLHVVPSVAARTGGTASAVVELCRGLSECGVDSTVYATDLAEPPQARAGRHRVVTVSELPPGADAIDLRTFPTREPKRLAYSPELARALARDAPKADVVHIHSLFLYPQFAGYRAAARAGTPHVVSPHGCLDPFMRRRGRARKRLNDLVWQRSMLRDARAIHFGADDEAALAADVAPGVARAVVPNAIDVAAFSGGSGGTSFRHRRLNGHAGPVVMHFGRIARKKGLDVLLRAFAASAPEDALLVAVGPDDDGLAPELRRLASSLGVARRLALLGPVYGIERAEALAAADVWALASHSEGCSTATLEALAAGRPMLVSTGVSLAKELAAENAAVVAAPEASAFGRALSRLLADDRRRADLGARARAFARRYDRRTVAARVADVYRAVAA